MIRNPFTENKTTVCMADNEQNAARPILAPATFQIGGNPSSTADTGNPIETGSNHNSNDPPTKMCGPSFKLRPPVLSNPFCKVAGSSPPEKLSSTESNTLNCTTSSPFQLRPSTLSVNLSDKIMTAAQPKAQKSSPTSGESSENLFSAALLSPNASAGNDDFVFGQNMNERVKNQVTGEKNGDTTSDIVKSPPVDGEKPAKSLAESASEYQQRQVKRTYDEVTVVTGEEDESNVMQMNCRLYTFDKTHSAWTERGSGFLRLNDKRLEDKSMQSRIVMRTQGTQRVILNTKVWPEMSLELPSLKTVRFSAMDEGQLKVVLVKGNIKDCEQLAAAIDRRILALRGKAQKNGDSQQQGTTSPNKRQRTTGPLRPHANDDDSGREDDDEDDDYDCDDSSWSTSGSNVLPDRRRQPFVIASGAPNDESSEDARLGFSDSSST